MNTRPLLPGLAAAFALAAAAVADEPAAAQKPADSVAAKPAAKPAADCTATGSHVRQKGPSCPGSASLRSYSQQDLQNTGETDLGQALKKLDPLFR